MSAAALRELAARAQDGDATAQRELTAAARTQARDILAQDRFREGHHHDGPLHGLFVWLSDHFNVLPGGTLSGWVLIVLVTVALAAVVLRHVRDRRTREWEDAPARVPAGARAVGPDELERQAAEAEARGDLDGAVRLRFVAGLLRLDRARAIELRPSLTSGDVGRALGSDRYDAVARTHDAVAYGGRTADGDDAAQAREQWPAIVGEAQRR